MVLHECVPWRHLRREVRISDPPIPGWHAVSSGRVTPKTASERRENTDIHFNALGEPRAGELHRQKARLIFRVFERDEDPFRAHIVEVHVERVVADLPLAEALQPGLTVLENGVLELLERLANNRVTGMSKAVGTQTLRY